jgi:hypothetical protein
LQALFNQDNGTGRVQSISAAGVTAIGPRLKAWWEQLPSFYTDTMSANAVAWSFTDAPTGNPGGTDGAVFACYGTPSFGMGAVGWNCGSPPGTNRDSYDKVIRRPQAQRLGGDARLPGLGTRPSSTARSRQGPGRRTGRRSCGLAPRQARPRC